MVPAGLTVASIMTDAASVVSQFGTLITIITGLSLGIFFVGWIASKVKAAKR